VTIVSANRGKWTGIAALAGWLRGVVSRCGRRNELPGINRAEFEQVARDLNLSTPELYGLSTGRRFPVELLEKGLAEGELSPEHVRGRQAPEHARLQAEKQAYLPISPSCC
jgi:hypothetical protein